MRQLYINTILSGFPFPDEGKMSDECSWLPQHFALALGVRNKISENDIRIMLSVDLLLTHRFSKRKGDEFIKCDESGKCALHLVAQYSVSLELLEEFLQIDYKMIKMVSKSENAGEETTPLGFLCRRRHFPTFDAMVLTLTEVDSSMDNFFDGMINHIRSYKDCLYQDILLGSRGAKSLILLGSLLDANPAFVEYQKHYIFHLACMYLGGESGISVLSLLLSKNGTGVKIKIDGSLPIHFAAFNSCLEVVKFLHKAYPESISMLDDDEKSLLHLAAFDNTTDIADVISKVQYLCDQ
jgi:hypothetical protein